MLNFLFKKNDLANYEHLDLEAYLARFHEGAEKCTLVDVRSQAEFAGGHVPGAVNIPLDQLAERKREVPADKPVVVICASGNRSKGGAKILADAGLKTVYNLKGGTLGWRLKSLPLKTGAK